MSFPDVISEYPSIYDCQIYPDMIFQYPRIFRYRLIFKYWPIFKYRFGYLNIRNNKIKFVTMERLFICIAIGLFIMVPLVLICFDIDTSLPEPGEFDIKDPWTGETID